MYYFLTVKMLELTECDSSPCQNGGTCTERMIHGYTCFCAAGYEGDNCESGKSFTSRGQIIHQR